MFCKLTSKRIDFMHEGAKDDCYSLEIEMFNLFVCCFH